MAVGLELVKIVKTRIDKAGELRQATDDLIGDLEKHLEESPDKFQEIKNAYLAKVASQQADILSDFPDFQQWSKVDSFLGKVERFSRDVEDAVLNPERTEFLGLFEKWLQNIEVALAPEAEVWLKSCLKSASKASIAKLKDEVVQIAELSKGLKNSILSQAKIMVKNELVELTKRDKTVVDNLVEWIEKAEKGFLQGSDLLKAWDDIKKEQADESFTKTPVKKVVERFVILMDGVLDRKLLKGEGFDKGTEFWEEIKRDIQTEWIKLKPKCPVIASQYDRLPEHAKSLLVKEVASWKVKRLEEINTSLEGLTETAGEILEVEDTLENIEADWSSLEGLSENSKRSDLKALLDKLASIQSDASNLATKSSLKEYLGALNDLSKGYNQWLNELEKLRKRWVQETKPWIAICKRQVFEILTKLEQELSSLQDLNAQSNTIGEIVNKYLDLKRTIEGVRNILSRSLSEQKLQILDKIAELEAEKEEVLIEDLKQKLGRLDPADLNNIVSLSEEDRLLNVKISTRG